jgi:HK97 family phage major capsid protein
MPATNPTIRSLQAKKAALVSEARTLLKLATSEDRDFTDAETASYDALKEKIDKIQANIAREEGLAAMEAQIDPRAAGHVTVHDNRDDDPKRGFKSFGDFARAVVQASDRSNGFRDDRLHFEGAAPGTFANESAGADGGFLVPPEFSKQIWTFSLGEDSLVPYTDNHEVTGNSMVFPKDDDALGDDGHPGLLARGGYRCDRHQAGFRHQYPAPAQTYGASACHRRTAV